MKIFIVGGHLSPALAVIDDLKKLNQGKIIFIGRKYPISGEKTISLEYQEINKRGIKFINLETGRLTRVFSFRSFLSFLKIFNGFLRSFIIVLKYKPDIILSFGGYLAFPVVFWGYFLGSKIFTHEQTATVGLANKLISLFSKKIFISFKETEKFFPRKKTILTGNPIKKSIFKIIDKPFLIDKKFPVIYITGGTLGSHSINNHIKKILPELLEKYAIIHQTGDTEEYHDYEDLIKIKERLSKDLSKRYFLKKHFFDNEIGYIYSISDLVIGRSGANTFFELIALEKPALFIPLPWSARKEQQCHAEIFLKNECGEVFNQNDPAEKLLKLIDKMMVRLSFYKKNFHKLKKLFYIENASKKIIKEIFS